MSKEAIIGLFGIGILLVMLLVLLCLAWSYSADEGFQDDEAGKS